jgi:hypothetical protein
MAADAITRLHYGTAAFDLADEDSVTWRDVSNRYRESLAQGAGWVEVPTVDGVVTLLASPGIPVYFTQTRFGRASAD